MKVDAVHSGASFQGCSVNIAEIHCRRVSAVPKTKRPFVVRINSVARILMKPKPKLLSVAIFIALVGCSGVKNREQPDFEQLGVPQQWQGTASPGSDPNAPLQLMSQEPSDSGSLYSPLVATTAQTRWVKSFNDPGLTLLVERVLSNNAGLAAEAAKVQSAGAGQIQTESALYPTLDLTGSISRNQTGNVTRDQESISLNAGFELDVWGKLSAREKEASLNFAAARADFTQIALDLSAEAATGWYNLIAQKKLLELYKRREDTLSNALKVIEQGYNKGLKAIDDLYSARNNLQAEKDNISAQKQVITEQVRALQVLLGRYPDGRLLSDSGLDLPDLPAFKSELLPSELISRSPSLQSQWLTLLAADAGLAAANRDRFPSISLSASVDQNIDWNLMASLTQPLFNAGKLAAAEDQAEANVQQQEKLYLKAVFSTFADVENALMQETTLEHRYAIANDNLATARQSTALALNQYQLGLTELDALLSIQKSMIDTEAQVIRLQNQRLANRISLYQLLGGDTRPVVSRDIPKPSDAL